MPEEASPRLQLDLHVGVLHYEPHLEPFPLLVEPDHYDPNTVDITLDLEERQYWLGVLNDQVPTYVQKAAFSQGLTAGEHASIHLQLPASATCSLVLDSSSWTLMQMQNAKLKLLALHYMDTFRNLRTSRLRTVTSGEKLRKRAVRPLFGLSLAGI